MRRSVILSLLLLCAVVGLQAQGQKKAPTVDFRDVTAAGPFPFYINMQYTRSIRHNDFRALSAAFHNNSPTRTNDRSVMRGYEANFGVSFSFKRKKLLRHLFAEAGYRYLTRNLKDNQLRLGVTDKLFSIRLGYEYTAFFPLTFQLQAGPAFNRTYQFDFDSLNGQPTSPSRIELRERVNRGIRMAGLDTRLRVLLLNSVGTGGGLGFFLEARYVRYNRRYMFDRIISEVGNPQNTIFTDGDYFTFGVGVIAPIALRVQKSSKNKNKLKRKSP